ncbi:formylglycine-generating enzyme family protein, partial [Myxococcota bacterium]|nr:formylglycine-generating enzyme family protein [Myxococcota bacterium]
MLIFALIAQFLSPSFQLPYPCGKIPSGMSCVPGGWFIRGANDQRRDQRPRAKIYVNTFLLDRYEVTAGEYDRCVLEGRCVYQKTNYNHFSHDDQPKVGLSWYAARNYCRVMGKDLPTEAQWEKAARGPDGEKNPWGNESATCSLAVIMNKKGRGCGAKAVSREKGRTADVGSRPVGRYGLYDMI